MRLKVGRRREMRFKDLFGGDKEPAVKAKPATKTKSVVKAKPATKTKPAVKAKAETKWKPKVKGKAAAKRAKRKKRF